ncbi:MAG: hypothetical protein M9894_30385 [Planctomycetes bacterium]|nr:hypothetical protein [Planctomycetota bacterium]
MHLPRRRLLTLGVPALVLLLTREAAGYGYTREEDPLLRAFDEAVRATRQRRFDVARAQLHSVQWQVDELRSPDDLRVDLEPLLRRAHGEGATEAGVIAAWANLVYLALLQKFHWNLREQLTDYHKARARLESAWGYYEIALAGNVRQHDAERRKQSPEAPSRHDDVVRRFEVARAALGSPGLFGVGARAPDPKAFRAAVVAIAGHLRAVFPGFQHPGG